MAQGARRRRKRRGDSYRSPPKGGEGRQRAATRAGVPATRRPSSRAGRRSGRDRPPAPWGSFPLVELVVLLAIVILVAGFFVQGNRGVVMIAAGITLGSLAGLELSIREHFAGYRSHSSVLAGVVAVLAMGAGFFLLPGGWQPTVLGPLVGAAVFGVMFYLFREAFKRRSGGLGWR
jgi:hypothetical protein